MKQKRPQKCGRAHGLLPLLLAALAGGAVVFVPGATESAKANGDTRTIYLHHAHTHESIAATYLVDGQYDSTVLDKLNFFLRDWRRDEQIRMDPHLFDVIWTVYRESGSAQPIEVLSAYRSPETNAMLRRRSRAVAEHSQHILGKAMDQHYVDVPMSRIREIAMKLQRGGVGFYPTAGTPFVHMDVGGVRHWPRMSYEQLSRLFPDGKTVHIPSNGQPLPGYEEARAELEARGDSFNYPTANEVKSKGFFAWLFGGGDEEEDNAAAQTRGGRRGQQRVASIDPGTSGSIPPSGVFGMESKDAGVHAFNMASASPPPSSYGTLPQRRIAPVQAPPPVRQAATERPVVAERPDPRAEQALALAMAEQERAKLAAAPVAADIQPAPNPSPQIALAAQALASADATTAPSVPMPPRRPIELASEGPLPPLPPGRPAEFASLAANTDRSSGVTPAKKDMIGALLSAGLAGRATGLPAAITQGPGAAKTALPPPRLMAFASPIAVPAPLVKAFVPVPVARPSFVPARLDRSNFRSLTGSGNASKMPLRSGLGSAVSALRPAAQTSLGAMAGQAAPGTLPGFAARASDLPTDHFSGSALKPREHVVTSNGSGFAPSGTSAE